MDQLNPSHSEPRPSSPQQHITQTSPRDDEGPPATTASPFAQLLAIAALVLRPIASLRLAARPQEAQSDTLLARSSSTASPPSPRPPSKSDPAETPAAGMNGINGSGAAMQGGPGGAAGAAAMGVSGPTPAGHQAELNIIYTMVEDLSKELATNRRVTEDIVGAVGRVRNRAREKGLTNDEVLAEVADEIFAQENNLDTILSVLTEALDRAKNSRDANFQLVTAYARVLSTLLSHFHAYKQKHIADVSSWHRSYRTQLAEARAENSRLREQIWEMQEHAAKANAMLREFRKHYDEDKDRMDRRVEARARRQEIRFWKRLAMPDVPDDDTEVWSDDDDLVDPVEKERLRENELKMAEQRQAGMGSSSSQQGEDSEDEDGGSEHEGLGGLGGVAMERDSSTGGIVIPTPPPRPASTGSTGGRSG